MITWLVVILLLFHHSQAQFIQRYNDVNGEPHWRRQLKLKNNPVLQPKYPVILEYNCARLPSICINVNSWINNKKLSEWNGRAGLDVFNYDLNAGDEAKYTEGTFSRASKANSDHRRELACTQKWKNEKKECPESNQPAVLPGPWPYTDLETIDPVAKFEIEDMRFPDEDQPSRSGRAYSCDEFPPASWIEGGVGMENFGVPEGDGQPGTTFCAPIGNTCKKKKKKSSALKARAKKAPSGKIASEQDWQGSSHGALRLRLQKQLKAENNNILKNSAAQFHLRLVNEAGGYAAKIYYHDYDNGGVDTHSTISDYHRRSIVQDFPSNLTFYERANLGSSMGRRDLIDYGYKVDTLITDENEAEAIIRLAEGHEITASDLEQSGSLDTHLRLNSTMTPLPSASASTTLQGSINVTSRLAQATGTALAVFHHNSTEELQTQQQPEGDAIDIIALSEMYILGLIGSSNNTRNHTNHNATSIPHRRMAHHPHSKHGHSHISPHHSNIFDQRAVEGPIQWGVGKPCKDGACCNKDGKCGFKEAQCGADVCVSNCDAKAMCGIDSPGGTGKCGLKLCCSFYGWCGTQDVHCYDPEPKYGKTPCQQGYGSCDITEPPSCGKDSGTSGGRRVAYYQGWNMCERVCNKIKPKQINTAGLTHLYYSFVFFHPTTFEIMPMNEADVPLYKEFTDLKTNMLQTWVAIGVWSFNEPDTPTATAFSDMVSSAGNRAAFITSLMRFMDTYGFQGADIDWEYPAESKRGGRPEDTDNLVLLMKEMRAAFSNRYGLSIVLAPDYWYLRGFKPAEMQDYVDHMGFMSYDLHGPWDTDVLTLGSIVRPQTDITEIDKGLTPLWCDGVDPAKINLGIAYYGRSYKLADPSCNHMGCSFIPKEGGAPGKCTAFPGVMSNREIRQLIEDENITPSLNETAMVKYFTYGGDSWITYDDEETYAMKEAFANDRCLGGIMIWSIDFDAEVGGGSDDDSEDENLVWVDPKIWEEPTPTVQCFFPSYNSARGTLTFPPITVTEYAMSTMIIPSGDRRRAAEVTTEPTLSTTTTWPESTWTDNEGWSYSTRPTRPTLQFPTPGFHLNYALTLHVRNGAPSPTVSACAFSALDCPSMETQALRSSNAFGFGRKGRVARGPSLKANIEYHFNPSDDAVPEDAVACLLDDSEEEEPDEEDNNDPDDSPDTTEPGTDVPEPVPVPPPVEPVPFIPPPLFIPNPHPWSTVPFETPVPAGPTATVPFETPVPAFTYTPDFGKDSKPNCYNSGLKVKRSELIEAIDKFCAYVAQSLHETKAVGLGPGLFQHDNSFKVKGQKYTDLVVTFEIKDNCEWNDFEKWTDCNIEFRKIVDGCNTKGENGKQGGTMDGNCIKWRVDPNTETAYSTSGLIWSHLGY